MESRPMHRTWSWTLLLILPLAFSILPSDALGQQPLTVAITVDDTPAASARMIDAFRSELLTLTRPDLDVVIPDALILGAAGTLEGARSIHDRLLADDDVDLVVTLGMLVSAEIVDRRDLPRPVIAPFVVPGWVSDAPLDADGGSGVPNLTYVQPVFDFVDDVRRYRELVDFDDMAVIASPGLAALVASRGSAAFELPNLDLILRPVGFDGDVATVVDALPASVDVVLVAGPTEDQFDDFGPLFNALTERGLPAFSTTGELGVRNGALAGLTPANWLDRVLRRTALHARRILVGEAARDLPVQLTRQETYSINMGVARQLGISPTFDLMSDAQLIGGLTREPERTVDLLDVMGEAVAANRDLQAARRDLDAATSNVAVARTVLLPQLDALLGARRIDDDRAGTGSFGAETTVTAGAELTQILWSEDAWANVAIQRRVADATRSALRQVELDVQLEAAEAFFDVLASLAVEGIRRDNLRLTRNNLERARVRQRLGAASPAEEYRWESQVARDQDALVTSIARRNLAEIQLNRVLNLPLEQKLGVRDAQSWGDLLAYLDPRFLPYIDDPVSLRRLRAYVAQVALENSPEIGQIDAAIAVQQRLLDSQTRSFFSPELALTGELTQTLDRSGNGADLIEGQLDLGEVDDLDWSLTLGLSLPLFEGGGRFAERSRLAADILRLEREREALAERIEQRARSSVHVASASFTRIRLTERAEKAARQNFELVADAYAEGAVSIIDLLDAQTAWLNAQQERANSLFQLMTDVMEVERATGHFIVLSTEDEKDDVFERLGTFMTPETTPQED